MATMAWTKVQREPKIVAEAAEQQDVILVRRDAENLVLGTELRRRRQAYVLVVAGHLMRSWAEQASLNEAITREFPWLVEMPEELRVQFRSELLEVTLSAAELDQSERIADLIADWKATAAVYTDPELRNQLSRPLAGGYGKALARPEPA